MKRMYMGIGVRAVAMAAGLVAVGASMAAEPVDNSLSEYLGREITLDPAAESKQLPAGGKLTLVHDAKEDVVRVCTRTSPDQKSAWTHDLAKSCNVKLTFKRGERYCTVEDVKAGNGEVLSSCHRLRSSEVATSAAGKKDSAELADMIVFLLSPDKGEKSVAILIDSPARVTWEPVIIGKY
jgi:hypothetical protein